MKKITVLLIIISFFSCGKDEDPVTITFTSGTVTDSRDGTVYNTVTLGGQTWMAENLAYLTDDLLNNGGWVYNFTGSDLAAAKATNNFKNQGVLYNWETAQNACPDGWHIPSDAEWNTLFDNVGGKAVAGGHLKATGTSVWPSPNTAADNASGFSATPSGGYYTGPKVFEGAPGWCHYWSSTATSSGDVEFPSLAFDQADLYFVTANRNGHAFAVRCIEN